MSVLRLIKFELVYVNLRGALVWFLTHRCDALEKHLRYMVTESADIGKIDWVCWYVFFFCSG